jgi:hypothetical protein
MKRLNMQKPITQLFWGEWGYGVPGGNKHVSKIFFKTQKNFNFFGFPVFPFGAAAAL